MIDLFQKTEFMGIRLDPEEVYAINQKKTGVIRKNGCIINTGSNILFSFYSIHKNFGVVPICSILLLIVVHSFSCLFQVIQQAKS
jgi:hypothetical protein